MVRYHVTTVRDGASETRSFDEYRSAARAIQRARRDGLRVKVTTEMVVRPARYRERSYAPRRVFVR